MANDLEWSAGVTGVDEAVAKLREIDAAAARVHGAQQQRFSQSVEQVREQVEFADAYAKAVERAKAREVAAFERAVQAARDRDAAMRQGTTATQQATRASDAMATSAIAFATKLQGAASAVTALASAVGNPNSATGLVANVAATTAQFAALGNMLGPGGALIAGVVGFSYAVANAVEATNEASSAQSQWRSELGLSIDAIDEYVAAAQRMATAQQRMSMIQQGLGDADEQFAAANLAGQRVGDIAARRAQVRQERDRLRMGSRWQDADRIAELDRQFAQLTGDLEAARAESQRLGQLALQAQQEQLAIQEDEVTLGFDETVARGSGRADRRFGIEGRQRRDDPMVERMREFFEQAVPDQEARARAEARLGDTTAEERIFATGDQGLDAFLGEQASEGVTRARELADAYNEATEAQKRMVEQAAEASRTFSEGWVASIDEVIERWQEANRALRASGQQMLSQSRLMERGMVAVGNSIAETIGGTMKGAFTDALGAWLDGSKSFVQAAEEMAKGVVKALTIEAIVQAVTEIARGIAALAGQRYDQAPLHFAAAAAWGAVGAAAGAVGAATGAFGGGGEKAAAGGGADARSLGAGAVQERERGETLVLHVYPGQVFATEDQVNNAVFDAVDMATRRNGRRFDRRAIPRGR